jgi:hypothetical protein
MYKYTSELRADELGIDVWQVVRRDGGQVDGKWMANA